MEHITVKLEESAKTLTILEGKASEPFNPKQQVLKGNIYAPSNFFLTRKDNLDFQKCHVFFNSQAKNIQLIVNENQIDQITVLGLFTQNAVFDELLINKPNSPYESHIDLMQALKYKGFIFESPAVHRDILQKLSSFKATVTKKFEQQKETNGNSKNSVEVEMNIEPLEFEIYVSVFGGMPKKKLKVMVEVSERNGKPIFFLTSLELPEMSINEIETAMESLKLDFDGIVIIDL